MSLNSIADFSLQAATKYLQSAVFIDDNIYNQVTANPGTEDTEPRQPKTVMVAHEDESSLSRKPVPAVEKPESHEQSKQIFRTKDLVGSFAEFGIVCALYEPEAEFPVGESSTIFKLCQTADLVILDWDFHQDKVQGTKPKALIENLIRNGNQVAPHHVRLIAIYTNTPSLHMIANSVFQHLSKAGMEVIVIECPFRLEAGSSRVVVLGKAGGAKRVEEEESFTVSEKDLPARMLLEFSKMNHGILPSCALLGMAAVRHSSARILDKFHGDLDAQFLLHRALIRNSEEAFAQLPELLGDEFKAVIEDAYYSPQDAAQFIEKACSDIEVRSHTAGWKVGGRPLDEVIKEFWSRDNPKLTSRLNGKKKADSSDGMQPDKLPVADLAGMCSANDGAAHRRFASLLAVRTQYKTDHRDLGFGSIVLNPRSGEYSVCIMPLCDSLRLKGETNFPFWTLIESGKGHPIIVQAYDGKWLALAFDPGKPSRYMWFTKFASDPEKHVVRSVKAADGKFIFRSGEADFEWVAQLKPSHAQRIANIIGQQLSRVGLNEAEWARIAFSKE